MSETHVPAALRRAVLLRAEGLCEYCLISDEDTFLGGQIDHVISEKHGGATTENNLAYSCTPCNQAKGSDVGSIDRTTGEIVRLFNPRMDRWSDHFAMMGGRIDAISRIGEVTVRIMRFNLPERIEERFLLRRMGRYLSPAAIKRMEF